jgi:hypothetical protein
MTMTILNDYKKAPHLFQLSKIRLDDFSEGILSPPSDLIEFWTKFGSGELFETETMYSPSINEIDDSILDIQEHYLEKGMPPIYNVFHTGISISAYRQEEPRYVILEENTFKVIKCFNTLEEWYSGTLRDEYAERYGIG